MILHHFTINDLFLRVFTRMGAPQPVIHLCQCSSFQAFTKSQEDMPPAFHLCRGCVFGGHDYLDYRPLRPHQPTIGPSGRPPAPPADHLPHRPTTSPTGRQPGPPADHRPHRPTTGPTGQPSAASADHRRPIVTLTMDPRLPSIWNQPTD